jgi:hypothetical protein
MNLYLLFGLAIVADAVNHVFGMNRTLPPVSPAFAIASATCSNP